MALKPARKPRKAPAKKAPAAKKPAPPKAHNAGGITAPEREPAPFTEPEPAA